jgi:hypothetical protein
MNAARLAALPIDHVLAEMAVLPLASEAALRLCVTGLDPFLEQQKMESLWREAEHQVLGYFPSFSVDEAVAIRDYFWFAGNPQQKTPLHCYLPWLAGQYLENSGPVARPSLPGNTSKLAEPPDSKAKAALARLSWRWLSFAIPPDLLLAALGNYAQCPDKVELLSPHLERHLQDSGYAEIHLHIGAAMEFSHLWAFAMRELIEPTLKENAFASPGAGFNEGKKLAPWLLYAAIVRYVLASFLSRNFTEPTNLSHYLNTVVHPKLWNELSPVLLSTWLYGLSDVMAGNIDDSGLTFAQLQELYRRLLGSAFIAKSLPKELDQVAELDPISVFLPGVQNPEMKFVAMGLDYLENSPDDSTFSVLFWQVVRVRILFYRHVVQRPMTPGLQWFVRFYNRMRPAKRQLATELNVKSAAVIDGRDEGLKSLEFRTAPSDKRSSLIGDLIGIDSAYHSINSRPHSPLEMGLVLHFTKSRGPNADKGKPGAHWRVSHADPGCYFAGGKKHCINPTGYRYAHFYNQKRNQAQALAWVLWHFPCSLGLVRGIDVCTDELGVPTWVLAPLFRYLRDVSKLASDHLYRRCGVVVPPLRFTAHTGEDFIHLLTGLRNVDEAVRYFAMREGDRIGHGMSLGVDPKDWCKRAGRIPMPCEDRLFDLAWEWRWYAREGTDPPSGRASMLERAIALLSKHIFGEILFPVEVESFVDLLYQEEKLQLLEFPNGRPSKLGLSSKHPLKLLKRYLTSSDVFKKGREIVWVDTAQECEALEELQTDLRKKLGNYGIAVEVNPSSNLLIGDMSDLSKHPLWRLNPPLKSQTTEISYQSSSLSICIGSDDPLTFSTNLRHEYQFVHDALVLSGLSESEASQWLDQVRNIGLKYRFTLDTDHKPKFILPSENPYHPHPVNPVFNFDRPIVKLPP